MTKKVYCKEWMKSQTKADTRVAVSKIQEAVNLERATEKQKANGQTKEKS